PLAARLRINVATSAATARFTSRETGNTVVGTFSGELPVARWACDIDLFLLGITYFYHSGYKESMLEPRQREIVRTLWEQGRLSRWELHEKTGLTPNNVGSVAEALLKMGVLREGTAEPSGAGRPRVPLEIDPSRRHVVGLAIGPGRVEACRVGLRGH